MNNLKIPSMALVSAVLLVGCVKSDVTMRTQEGGILRVDPPTPLPVPPPAPPPTPTPPPPPVPPPPPATTLPPLSPTPIDISDNPPVGTPHWVNGDTAEGGHGDPMAGLTCYPGNDPPSTYHVHTHLSIFLDNVQLQLPSIIGIVTLGDGSKCVYTLHMHDHSGKIHVEGPAPAVFTLGQFFAIWGQPLEPDNVAGLAGKPVVVYVTDDNGVVTQATGDWHDIELISHREITIQVGTPIDEIPNYTWRAH